MEPLIAKFRYLSDAGEEIDRLVEKAKQIEDRQAKKEILERARELVAAYERHVGRKMFNQI